MHVPSSSSNASPNYGHNSAADTKIQVVLDVLRQRRELSRQELLDMNVSLEDLANNPKISIENNIARWRGIVDAEGIINLVKSEGALQVTEEMCDAYPNATADLWNLVHRKKVLMVTREDYKQKHTQLEELRRNLPSDIALMPVNGEASNALHGFYCTTTQMHHGKNVYMNRERGYVVYYVNQNFRSGWVIAPKLLAKEKFASSVGDAKSPEKVERWMANAHQELKLHCVAIEFLSWVLYPLTMSKPTWGGYERRAPEIRDAWRKQALPKLPDILSSCGVEMRRRVQVQGECGSNEAVTEVAGRERVKRRRKEGKAVNDHINLNLGSNSP